MKKAALTATFAAAIAIAAAACAALVPSALSADRTDPAICAQTSAAVTHEAQPSDENKEDGRRLPLLIVTGEGEYIADADRGAFYAGVSAVSDSAADAEERCRTKAAAITEAFAPYGSAYLRSLSTCGGAGNRAYAYYKFTLTDIADADAARTALVNAGAENVSACEYSESDGAGRAEAIDRALENAVNAAKKLGGGRLVKAEESYCYADGCSETGKVVYRASVRATFASAPARDRDERKPDKQPRGDETEYENNGNVYIIKTR